MKTVKSYTEDKQINEGVWKNFKVIISKFVKFLFWYVIETEFQCNTCFILISFHFITNKIL